MIRWAGWCAVALAAVLLGGCTSAVTGEALPVADGGPAAVADEPSDAVAPQVPESARLPPEVVEKGFTAFTPNFGVPSATYGVLVHNPNASTWVATAVYFDITLRNHAGAAVGTDSIESISTLLPGATAALTGGMETDGTDVASMDVVIRHLGWETADGFGPAEITAGPATTRSIAGPDALDPRLQVTCILTSTFAASVTNFNVRVIYRDAQGAIIGGMVAGADIDGIDLDIPPAVPTEVALLDLSPPPTGVPIAECHPNVDSERR